MHEVSDWRPCKCRNCLAVTSVVKCKTDRTNLYSVKFLELVSIRRTLSKSQRRFVRRLYLLVFYNMRLFKVLLSLLAGTVYFSSAMPTEQRQTNCVVQFELKLTWETRAPDGVPRKVILVNGKGPGPTMRLKEGDNVKVGKKRIQYSLRRRFNCFSLHRYLYRITCPLELLYTFMGLSKLCAP